jgi:hypothetical protein
MILMRLREITSCPEHQQAIIVLEDASGQRTLAIGADPAESCRLSRELGRPPRAAHPIYDFVDGLLRTFGIAPTRIVLEYIEGEGLTGVIGFLRVDGEASVSCYPSDALALAQRLQIPIYVNPDVFVHVRPFSPAPPPSGDEHAEWRQWLDRIKPGDFSPPGNRLTAE